MAASILICPTAFKGTLTASAAADAMARGVRESIGHAGGDAGGDIIRIPLSDGGNGLLDTLHAVDGGEFRTARVPDPIGEWTEARYLVQDGRVVVETAEACGLHLVPPERRDPLLTTTAGVGALLRAAADALPGPHAELVVGLGGSATVDAGAGMAVALGWSLLDEEGHPVLPCGSGLLRIARMIPPESSPLAVPMRVLADVANPLLGPYGAARIFGPQKGASQRDVPVLERGLHRWAEVVAENVDAIEDIGGLEGGGAAGGLGAAFAALFGARPERGAAWVLDAVGFDAGLASARAVVTGEGQWDAQSSMGKVTGEVVARARAAGIPVLVVAGKIEGALPEGVIGVEAPAGGSGGSAGSDPEEVLNGDGLARLAGTGLAGLLARHRRP